MRIEDGNDSWILIPEKDDEVIDPLAIESTRAVIGCIFEKLTGKKVNVGIVEDVAATREGESDQEIYEVVISANGVAQQAAERSHPQKVISVPEQRTAANGLLEAV